MDGESALRFADSEQKKEKAAMGMNQTPMSERTHIGFFGKRNAGKSSIINAVTGQDLAVVSDVKGQDLAVVSDVKGTTTDPVYKSMELLPLGPVVMMDTPGIDDEGELGSLRVRRSYQVLNKTDAAVLVIDGTAGASGEDRALLDRIRAKGIPFIVAVNKKELAGPGAVQGIKKRLDLTDDRLCPVSAATGEGIFELKERIAAVAKREEPERALVRDLLDPSDIVVLVVPIDSAAPKGRLILPQQQTIRDILEADAASVVVKENELKHVLYKGNLEQAVRGVTALDSLADGDAVLISEGCTHHRQCDDIGTVKIPRWIREYTGKDIRIETTSGTEFPDDVTGYKLIIHCGGCMLNEREMKYRLSCAEDQGVPMTTNYGILIAYVKGILKRSVEVFPEIFHIL